MGALTDRLTGDLKDAMRAGDAVRRDEIRGLLSQLQAENSAALTRALEKRGLILRDPHAQLTAEQQQDVEHLRATVELSDAEEQAVMQTRVKQHRQSIDGFRQGNRQDLVDAEERQLAALEPYLPKQLSDDELDRAIRDAIQQTGARGPRDMRVVMPVLQQRLQGQADMKQVSGRVQSLLGERTGSV